MSISLFLRRLFGYDAALSDFEMFILDSVRNKHTDDIAILWDKQIQAINKIQRLQRGGEVNFYSMKKGRPHHDIELAFPNKTEELLVAKVQLAVSNSKLIANVWCVRGFVFSIEYEGHADSFEEAYGEEWASEFVVNVKLLTDLSAKIE